MSLGTYTSPVWLREAARRLLQVIFGSALFDFPGLMRARLFALRQIATISSEVIIGKGFYFIQPHGLTEGYLRIGPGTRLNHRVEIDYSGGVTIGSNVWISQNVLIETHDHVITSEPKRDWRIETRPLEIEDEVWIGANAIILPGVTRIGRAAIVGAGAVVTKDVPAGVVVAGSPARIVTDRKRESVSSPTVVVERSS